MLTKNDVKKILLGICGTYDSTHCSPLFLFLSNNQTEPETINKPYLLPADSSMPTQTAHVEDTFNIQSGFTQLLVLSSPYCFPPPNVMRFRFLHKTGILFERTINRVIDDG